LRSSGASRRDVEEYSIDEAFADLTGFEKKLPWPYSNDRPEDAGTVEKELGITVSIGVSLSKVLAKLDQNTKKPSGITMMPGREIHHYLGKLPIESVWGIGPNTAAFLRKFLSTAFDFLRGRTKHSSLSTFKPYHEVWQRAERRSSTPS